MSRIDRYIVFLKPWIPHIKEVVRKHHIRSFLPEFFPGILEYVLAALLLRESLAGWADGYSPKGALTGWGDDGHAYSPWQFDKRDIGNRVWFQTEESRTFEGQTTRALEYLVEGFIMLRSHLLTVDKPEILLHATLAAYNADIRKVLHASKLGNPDIVTTGGDYSSWIMAVVEELMKSAPNLFE